MAANQLDHNLEAASLLHDVAEMDYHAGRLQEARSMAVASLRMDPANSLCQATLVLIEGALVHS